MKKIFKILKLNKKRKGSLTVEAAMIFPLIMFVMFAIIYLTIIHYQNNVMIAESIRAMNRAGAYWQYADMDKEGRVITFSNSDIPAPFDKNIESNKIIGLNMIKKRNAYRTIIDAISGGDISLFGIPVGLKKTNSKEYLEASIAGIKFKQYIEEDDNISWAKDKNEKEYNKLSMFFGDDLKMNIGRAYINPLIRLSKLFFGSNSVMEKVMKKDIVVSGVISNQSEFIRNLDTVYDIGTNLYELIEIKE